MIVLSPYDLWASPLEGAHRAATDPSNLVNEVKGKSVRLGEGTCGQRKDGFIQSRPKRKKKKSLRQQSEACMCYFLNFKQATMYKQYSS